MSIKGRLILVFALLVLLMSGIGAITIAQLSRVARISTGIATDTIGHIEHASHLSVALAELREAELAYIHFGTQGDEGLAWERLLESVAELRNGLRLYGEGINDAGQRRRFQDLQARLEDYLETHQALIAARNGGGREAALAVYSASGPEFRLLSEEVHDLRHDDYAQALRESRTGHAIEGRIRTSLITAFIVIAVLVLAMGWYLDYSIATRLRSLIEATRYISRGDLSHTVGLGGNDEVSRLAQAFNTMVQSLKQSQSELARLHRDRLTRVVRSLEEERKRISRELHDQASGVLTALHLGLARAARARGVAEMRRALAESQGLTVETMNVIRNLSMELRPSMLDEMGLVPALRYYAREYSRRVGIPVDLEVAGQPHLPPDAAVAVFRIVQEGLTNVAKHAEAHRVWVRLHAGGDELQITVEDDGRGFDVQRVLEDEGRPSLGLFGIQERVQLLRGTWEARSEPGAGTSLCITVPMATSSEGDGHEGGQPL